MNFLQNVEHVANKTILRDTSTKKLPNVRLLIKLATFGPGTNEKLWKGISRTRALRTKTFPILAYVHIYICENRQLDTFSKLCFSESEAFETKQLAIE